MAEPDRFMAERIKKADKLRELGVDPYGGRYEDVEPNEAGRAAWTRLSDRRVLFHLA